MNGAEALSRSGRVFRGLLAAVEHDDWDRPTPCTEWNVRDLVDHVVGGNFRYVSILAAESAPGASEEAWSGSDPHAAFDDGFARVTESFSAPEMLAATVRHPKVGEITGAQLQVLRVNELTVHGWDLARAIESDDRLDEDLVSWLLEHLEPLRPVLGLRPSRSTDERHAAGRQASLLRLFGREV